MSVIENRETIITVVLGSHPMTLNARIEYIYDGGESGKQEAGVPVLPGTPATVEITGIAVRMPDDEGDWVPGFEMFLAGAQMREIENQILEEINSEKN